MNNIHSYIIVNDDNNYLYLVGPEPISRSGHELLIQSTQLLTVFVGSSALRCVCHLCTNHTCETDTGGACWNSVTLVNGKEERVKSCLTPADYSGPVYCYDSLRLAKTHCCLTDFCNNETLHLYPGRAPSTVVKEEVVMVVVEEEEEEDPK